MKNASILKCTKSESPKTPGGISKSLLTPCRRLGLSRNWKKAGPSPFISPLSNNNSSVEVKTEKRDTRKRKGRSAEELEQVQESSDIDVKSYIDSDDSNKTLSSSKVDNTIIKTPSRHDELPKKKKSKILLPTINEFKENDELIPDKDCEHVKCNEEIIIKDTSQDSAAEIVKTPVRTKSKGKTKKKSPQKITNQVIKHKTDIKSKGDTNLNDIEEVASNLNNSINDNTKLKSPKELSKECVVVIQKNIFETEKKVINRDTSIINSTNKKEFKNKQPVMDSDSDDVPLCNLSTNLNVPLKTATEIIILDDDDDFTEVNKTQVKKLQENSTSIGGLKSSTKRKTKLETRKAGRITKHVEYKPSSQSSNSFDDDDEDFDFGCKKTILIRKTYDKVTKPLKAKSTGSVTQRDIDDLKARIEMKKKLLFAKTMSKDTEELRELIKKWQKGCQDALIELMDLMKIKFPDQQSMDYSEMLEMLRIPPALVHYDAEHDCFNTPDDASIILSKFNNL